MKSLVTVFLFGFLLFVVIVFFRGQHNSVNLYHICGKEVSWYDGIFLDAVEGKADCEKFQ